MCNDTATRCVYRDDVRIWLTEVGWAVPSGEYDCEPHPHGQGRCRRTYTVRNRGWQQQRMASFARRMREHERDWRIGPMFWYGFRDATAAEVDRTEHSWIMDCGLVLDAIDPMTGLRVPRSLDRYGRIARQHRWTRPPWRRQ